MSYTKIIHNLLSLNIKIRYNKYDLTIFLNCQQNYILTF